MSPSPRTATDIAERTNIEIALERLSWDARGAREAVGSREEMERRSFLVYTMLEIVSQLCCYLFLFRYPPDAAVDTIFPENYLG